MENLSSEQKKRPIQYWYALPIIVVLVLGYLYLNGDLSGSSGGNATTTLVKKGGITFSLPEGGDIKIEKIEGIGEAPAIKKDISFKSNISPEARQLIVSKYEDLEDKLKDEPYSYENWIKIGQLLLTAGDYEGAKDSWEYASKIIPTSPMAFSSLGYLYGYYLNDFSLAEINFLKAISNSPSDLAIYQQTFEFYRDVLKDESKAEGIAREGIERTGNKSFFNNLTATLR